MERKFQVVIPAELTKSDDGEWVVKGLASTSSRDQQGEIILPEGIDATPIEKGRGILNWDHQKGPENTVGLLDSYQKTPEGFFIKGRLFKNHQKAKSIHEIMSSLGKSDSGRMGLSVEGKILERAGKDGKTIKKCVINAVALTMNPVNQDSYASLAKSLNSDNSEVEFEGDQSSPLEEVQKSLAAIEKALGISAEAPTVPTERQGGDALACEDLEKKKLKKLTKSEFQSNLDQILNQIQVLYPNNTRVELWGAIKNRLNSRFPEIN